MWGNVLRAMKVYTGEWYWEKNAEGRRLLEFCDERELCVANTWFKKTGKRKITYSADGCLNRNGFCACWRKIQKVYKGCKNDVEFLETMEDEIPTNCQHETVDIIELPPENVDEMSDAEEFDEEEIGETQIVNVPGNVQVYVGTDDESEDVCKDQASIRKSKRAKIVLKEIPKWKKSAPKPTVLTIDNYNNKPVMEELIREFIDKNPFELFMLIMSGMFKIILHQSQIYAAQKNDPSFHCTIEDYMVFVGILLLSGHHPYPR